MDIVQDRCARVLHAEGVISWGSPNRRKAACINIHTWVEVFVKCS